MAMWVLLSFFSSNSPPWATLKPPSPRQSPLHCIVNQVSRAEKPTILPSLTSKEINHLLASNVQGFNRLISHLDNSTFKPLKRGVKCQSLPVILPITLTSKRNRCILALCPHKMSHEHLNACIPTDIYILVRWCSQPYPLPTYSMVCV